MTKQMGGRKLGVVSSHRRALLRNMATSLFHHERITTTVTKAKELRPFAERIITLAKSGSRAGVYRDIQDRIVRRKLFDVLAVRYKERPGGYMRILRLSPRQGDNAPVGRVELIS